jgi:hypothetical protein
VPEKSYGLPGNVLDRPESIVVAVGTGEDYDAKFHKCVRVYYLVPGTPSPRSIEIMGLEEKFFPVFEK